MATPMPVVPDQMPIACSRSSSAVKTLARIDSVDGMIAAPPIPMKARAAMSPSGDVAIRGGGRPGGEQHEAPHEDPLAPDAVAEAAEHEQQPGEDDDVGVHHPLQLARGGVHRPHDRRQRDVEDRAVKADDKEADAEHREDDAAVLWPGGPGELGRRQGRTRGEAGRGGCHRDQVRPTRPARREEGPAGSPSPARWRPARRRCAARHCVMRRATRPAL